MLIFDLKIYLDLCIVKVLEVIWVDNLVWCFFFWSFLMFFILLGIEFFLEGEGFFLLEEEEEEKIMSFDFWEYVIGLIEMGVYERGNVIVMKLNLVGEVLVIEYESNLKFWRKSEVERRRRKKMVREVMCCFY